MVRQRLPQEGSTATDLIPAVDVLGFYVMRCEGERRQSSASEMPYRAPETTSKRIELAFLLKFKFKLNL